MHISLILKLLTAKNTNNIQNYGIRVGEQFLTQIGFPLDMTDNEITRVKRDELALFLFKLVKDDGKNFITPGTRLTEIHGMLDLLILQNNGNCLKIIGLTELKNSRLIDRHILYDRLQEDADRKLSSGILKSVDFGPLKFDYLINSAAKYKDGSKVMRFDDLIVHGKKITVEKASASNEELVQYLMGQQHLNELMKDHIEKMKHPLVTIFKKQIITDIRARKVQRSFSEDTVFCDDGNYEIGDHIDFLDITKWAIYILGALILASIEFSKGLNIMLSNLELQETKDWYQTNLTYKTTDIRGLNQKDINFIKNFLESTAPQNSFKIKVFLLSEDHKVEYDLYVGFKIKLNINKVIQEILQKYESIPEIQPITRFICINLIWVIDEDNNWKVNKAFLENTVRRKKMDLIQKTKFLYKDSKNYKYNFTNFYKRSFSTSSDKTYNKIIKKSIPIMQESFIDSVLNNTTKDQDIKKHPIINKLTEKYVKFDEMIKNSVQEVNQIYLTNGQKKDIGSKITRFILMNTITTKKDFGFIALAHLVNFVYDYLHKIEVHTRDLNKGTRNIMNSILKNKEYLTATKQKTGNKNFYKNWTEEGKDTWVINIIDYTELQLITDQLASSIKEQLTCPPRDWGYENGNAYGGYDSLYNTVYTKLISINLSNKIQFKELGSNSFIDKINTLQKIGCRYNIHLFKYLFENYSIQEFDTLLYKTRDQFFETITKLYPNDSSTINKLKVKEGFGLQKEQLNTFLLMVLFLKRIENSGQKTLIYSNVRLDHRLRYYYTGLYNHMNSKILRTLAQVYPFSNPEKEISNLIKFYISWQISKSKSVFESFKKYEQFKKTNFLNKTEILKIRNPFNWLTVSIAIEKNQPFSISLDACASFQQILSIINKDSKLATFTNVTNISDDILDPYNYIIDKIKENIPTEFEDYKEILLSRKIVKQTVMTHTYGSNAGSIIKNLKSSGNLKLLKRNKQTIKLFNYIIQKFNEEFPSLKKLMSIIRVIAGYLYKNDIPTLFKYEDAYTKFTTNKTVKNNIIISVDEQTAIISITKRKEDTIDRAKTAQGLLANLVHFLDSQILLKTRLNLKKKGIDTLGVHDCFIIDHKCYEQCLTEYNKSLSELTDISIFDVLNVDKKNILDYLEKTNKKRFKAFTEDIKLFDTKPLEKQTILKAKFTLLPT